MPSAVVITCSTRAAEGEYDDRSGPLLVEALEGWGFDVVGRIVVADGPRIGDEMRRAVEHGTDVVITTGGTGISPSDETPEQTRPLLTRELPGIAEGIRAAGVAMGVPQAMLSRGLAGVAGRTVIVNLPGSTGGVRDALPVLEPVLLHAVDQLAGVDHHR